MGRVVLSNPNQDWRPGLSPGVPSGLNSQIRFLTHTLKPVPFRRKSFSAACKAVGSADAFYGPAQAVPFIRRSSAASNAVNASCADQIGQLKNLTWTRLMQGRSGQTKGQGTRA